MTFAERLKQLRTEHKLSMDEVGEYIGVGRANIYKYEHGMIENIPHDRLNKLAGLFGVSRSYLMGWTDERNSVVNDKLEDIEDREYTKKELNVINGLIKCISGNICDECHYNGHNECVDKLMRDALEIINTRGSVKPKKYPPTRYSESTYGCRACGHELAPGKPKFCHECGRPVKWE